MSKTTLIYIAGKVTGLDYEHTLAKFKAAADTIEGLDESLKVVNPMEIVEKDAEYNAAITTCLGYLKKCDYIVLLPDWVDSEGAQLEFKFATTQTIPAITFDNIESLPCLV